MKPTLLFLSADARCTQAVEQFRQVFGLFAGSYNPVAKSPDAVTDTEVSAAARVVVWDASLQTRFPTAAVWPDGNPAPQLAQLLAELMGGGKAYLPPPPEPPPKPKSLGTVKVGRETAGRKGKGVTVIWELTNLNDDGLKELCTKLKNKCGSGGTVKDGKIEIQGDHRDTIQAELEKIGYKVKRSGG
ncbi:MAG: hypothetical protein MUF18_17200 [Fimbriiglobus sp.]|nr:hypothetical protein [Fimbriiglobus sp.]